MIASAKFLKYEQRGTDTYEVIIEATSDAVPPVVSQERFTVTGTTQAEITANLRTQIAARNDQASRKSVLDAITPGTSIPVTAPSAGAQSAHDAFFGDIRRYLRLKALADAGVTIPTSAVTNLAASLTSRLAANVGWLADF